MKLKELPQSLFGGLKLLAVPVPSLVGDASGPVAPGVLVSLTSIESRLWTLPLVIRSLLLQDVSPERIVLWLHEDLRDSLPSGLRKLQSSRFEIGYTKGRSSHRKLVEPLGRYPDFDIVTCDDDVMYHPSWLRRLLDQHADSPADVVAHECRVITLDAQGQVRPYREWQTEAHGNSQAQTISIGYGGVLYPAGRMPPATMDAKLYMRLAPRADDLWFKAVGLAHGLQVRRTTNPPPKPTPIPFTQRVSLKAHNIKEGGNLSQWLALEQHFGIGFGSQPTAPPEGSSP